MRENIPSSLGFRTALPFPGEIVAKENVIAIANLYGLIEIIKVTKDLDTCSFKCSSDLIDIGHETICAIIIVKKIYEEPVIVWTTFS